jgi:hypothetical protein
MFRIKSLTIHKFREFKPGTHLDFDDGFNIILGKNATGKSSLLQLLDALLVGDISFARDEPFALEYTIDSEYSAKVEVSLSNESAKETGTVNGRFHLDCKISVDFAASEARFSVHRNREKGEIFFGDERHNLRSNQYEPYVFFRSCLEDIGDVKQLLAEDTGEFFEELLDRELYIPSVFDEALIWFKERSEEATFVVDDGKVQSPRSFGRNLSAKLHQNYRLNLHTDRLIAMDEFEPQLLKLMNMRHLQMSVPIQFANGKRTVFGKPQWMFTRESGTRITHELLSFGEQRLLAFFWYLDCAGDVVLVDELVNGMHHSWIGACVEAMDGRQVFATSQNPLLLEHMAFRSKDDVKSCFIVATSETDDAGNRELTLNHPTDEQAAAVFSSYEVGFQQVASILKENGLW